MYSSESLISKKLLNSLPLNGLYLFILTKLFGYWGVLISQNTWLGIFLKIYYSVEVAKLDLYASLRSPTKSYLLSGKTPSYLLRIDSKCLISKSVLPLSNSSRRSILIWFSSSPSTSHTSSLELRLEYSALSNSSLSTPSWAISLSVTSNMIVPFSSLPAPLNGSRALCKSVPLSYLPSFTPKTFLSESSALYSSTD